mmetsp:Transcript_72366/g.140012  ORF Transcript_72366/g.140012 Transcript_72366/m.140012 type:complete len:191 (-) Transcript_72366:187-759(-)
MLIPMPSPPMGPPTEYVMRRRWLMLAILIVQTVSCLLRMVIILDILGGFIMGIGIAFGWYAYKQGMEIQFICSWGMMCLINGAFDLVRFIDHWVKSPLPLFSSEAPGSYNAASAILLVSPLAALAGSWLAWYIYKSYSDDAPAGGDWGAGGGGWGAGAATAGGNSERSRLLGCGGGFQPFEGGGQRLGSG